MSSVTGSVEVSRAHFGSLQVQQEVADDQRLAQLAHLNQLFLFK
jgi:hypothetical protein